MASLLNVEEKYSQLYLSIFSCSLSSFLLFFQSFTLFDSVMPFFKKKKSGGINYYIVLAFLSCVPQLAEKMKTKTEKVENSDTLELL